MTKDLPELNPCKVAYVLISQHRSELGILKTLIQGVFSTRELAEKRRQHRSEGEAKDHRKNWIVREYQVDIGF